MYVDPTPHLIVPYAGCSPNTWLQAESPIEPKNLNKLMRGMKLVATDSGDGTSLSPPHERVFARALNLTAGQANTDGLLPLAALEAQSLKVAPHQAWGFITLCHWSMGREHATLTDPAVLKISRSDSYTLLDAMQPYFLTSGITLHYQQPSRWLAEGAVFADLPTASIDRAMGRNVDPLLPPSKAIKLLQNEMQMLLYAHPVNDARAANRQTSVNSFWLSGTGALREAATANPAVTVYRGLLPAALADDWAAFAGAWEQLDATDLAQLLSLQNSGQIVRISLCGDANAMTFETAGRSIFSKIRTSFSPQSSNDLLRQL